MKSLAVVVILLRTMPYLLTSGLNVKARAFFLRVTLRALLLCWTDIAFLSLGSVRCDIGVAGDTLDPSGLLRVYDESSLSFVHVRMARQTVRNGFLLG